MSVEYAMQWLVKKYGDDINSWPLGMARKCSEFMSDYSNEMVEYKLKELAKRAAEAEKGKVSELAGSEEGSR